VPGVGVPGPDDVQQGLGHVDLVAAQGRPSAALMVRGAAEANGASGRLFEVALVDDVPPVTRERSATRLAEMRKAATSHVALVLRDSAGTELARYPLADIGPPVHGVAGAGFAFVEWVDAQEGLASVAIEWQGGTAERTASATAPRVDIVGPGTGTALDRPFTLEWRGQDADGDPLVYDVLASADGGRTWRVIARHLAGTSVALDTHQMKGSDRARLRVRASDGFHTAQADTGDVKVPDSGPQLVLIMSPREGSTYPTKGLVVLSARASDLEDGRVERFTWSSDRDGELGRGAQLETRELSPGEHRITVQATDKAGNTAEASVGIVIDGAQVADVPDRATLARLERILHEHRDTGGSNIRLWAVGGAAALLLGVAVVVARRRRAV
jgi:LPXTG-motif cell wall-anchored protein